MSLIDDILGAKNFTPGHHHQEHKLLRATQFSLKSSPCQQNFASKSTHYVSSVLCLSSSGRPTSHWIGTDQAEVLGTTSPWLLAFRTRRWASTDAAGPQQWMLLRNPFDLVGNHEY